MVTIQRHLEPWDSKEWFIRSSVMKLVATTWRFSVNSFENVLYLNQPLPAIYTYSKEQYTLENLLIPWNQRFMGSKEHEGTSSTSIDGP